MVSKTIKISVAVSVLAVVAIIGTAAFFSFFKTSIKELQKTDKAVVAVSFPARNVSVNAKVADTAVSRAQGLSGTEPLKEDEGMFFVFDNPGRQIFFMKDMKYSLDIFWLDESKKIIFIEREVSPDTYPKTFSSDKPAKYVLEVIAGFAERHGVSLGDMASW